MKVIFFLVLLISYMETQVIYDFTSKSNPSDWKIVDDVVMGGISNGNFEITSEGHGLFSGYVSTENNGGFSSVRYPFEAIPTNNNSKIVLKLKGDRKEYQLRIKDSLRSYYSYVANFKTTTSWEEITIELKDLYPSFRGRKLDMPNYNSPSFEEISILIGNKKDESFKLMIDKIELDR